MNINKLYNDQGRQIISNKNEKIQQFKHTPLMEGMVNNIINNDFDNKLNSIKLMETEFNDLLAQYSNLYNSYINNEKNNIQSNNSYSNKNVVLPTGAIYFVNNKNVARYYSKDAWAHKSKTCDISLVHIDTDDLQYLGLTIGDDMGIYEKCITITDIENYQKQQLNKLNNLNSTLISKAKFLMDEINDATNSMNNMDTIDNQQQEQLGIYINKMNELQSNMNSHFKNNVTLQQMMNDQKSLNKQSYYSYIIWFIIASSLLFVSYKYAK